MQEFDQLTLKEQDVLILDAKMIKDSIVLKTIIEGIRMQETEVSTHDVIFLSLIIEELKVIRNARLNQHDISMSVIEGILPLI